MDSGSFPTVSVAQLGARMHYAVPRILQNAGILHRLYTDACATKGFPRLLRATVPDAYRQGPIRRLLDRVPKEVPPHKITAFTLFGLRRAVGEYWQSSLSEQTAHYLSSGRQFGHRVVRSKDFRDADGVYAFKTAALEILSEGKKEGMKTILEQPNVHRGFMDQLLQEEHRLHPGWAESRGEDEYREEEYTREQREWERADLIICPSEFVKQGIGRADGPVDRTTVVPYGVDFPVREKPRQDPERPMHVLSVGTVSLRKGAPYVLEAARRSTAQFRMVGSINLKPEGRKKLAQEVELLGQVPRSEIDSHYEWADVFILPSICEGSATVIYEALAHALPVICTPNTGSIVEDGTDGFIVPIRESDPIVDRLEQLASDLELYRLMSRNALRRYREEGTLKAYGERLALGIRRVFSDQ